MAISRISSATKRLLDRLANVHGYKPALLALLAAGVIHFAIRPVTGPSSAAVFFVYIAAIIIAGWCGYGPGVTVVVLAVCVLPFTYRENYSLKQINPGGMAALLMTSLFVSLASGVRRKSERDLMRLNDVLEDRVRQRTAELELANERLRSTQAQLELVTQSTAAAITRCSRDHNFIWVNSQYAEWIGKPVAEITGKPIASIVGKTRFQAAQPYIDEVLAGKRVEFQALLDLPARGRRWVHSTLVPTFDSRQEVDGWVGHVTDISAMREAQEELDRVNSHLRDANSHLARINDDLERFAFVASHDLQEPLRMISIYSQLLVQTCNGAMTPEAQMYAGTIVDGTRRMRQLLSDILAYTDIDKPNPESASIDLNVLLDHVRQNLSEAIESNRATISSDWLPTLNAPEGHLLPLFQNLIGNSIKYRRDDPPRIHIGTYVSAGAPHFTVADNGIGIAPEYHDQIFTVFKRLHGAKIPGTGIGLAICQKIVQRQGGRIWVDSTVGAGTTIHFSLPGLDAGKGAQG